MLKQIKSINSSFSAFNTFGKNLKKVSDWLKQKKRLSLSLLTVLIIGGFWTYQKLKPLPLDQRYELSTVKPTDIEETVIASGKIASQTQVDLKFQTSGRLAWVGVEEGEIVKKWQALASLDQRELQKGLEKTLLDYSKERNDFEEDIQVTYKDTVLTDSLKRLLEKNQWDLNKTVLDVELKDIALKYASLISPIDGLVTHIDVPVAGVNVTPATAVFTVADPNKLTFIAEIDEVDVSKLIVGQQASLVLDAYSNDVFKVSVDWIDFSATVDSSGATVYLVKFNLENSEGKLRLGMNGEVTIVIASKNDILTVPLSSITETEQGISIDVIVDGHLETRLVTTGLEGEEDIEITSGLTSNEIVVVSKKSKS
jgi:RND family efflux transporter MFP subunit